MAQAVHGTTSQPIAGAIAHLLEGLATRLRQYRVYRTTVMELNALSTRELDDLGLNRSQITGLAREAARKA